MNGYFQTFENKMNNWETFQLKNLIYHSWAKTDDVVIHFLTTNN